MGLPYFLCQYEDFLFNVKNSLLNFVHTFHVYHISYTFSTNYLLMGRSSDYFCTQKVKNIKKFMS